MESLDSLRPMRKMVTYGNASGPPPAMSPLELSKRGSLYLTLPTIWLLNGIIVANIGQAAELADESRIHIAMQQHVLIPS
jgi:NADPH:quinone reductase